MKAKNLFFVFISAFSGALLALGGQNYFKKGVQENSTNISNQEAQFQKVSYSLGTHQAVNFVGASSIATPAVVHVNTSYTVNNESSQQFYGNDLFEYFFGPQQRSQPRESVGSGSGVIISSDGYIVTNNHVIENSNEIKVNLSNHKTYKAQLIGKDKDTDLALLKIEATGLPYLKIANSDSILVGEWVLAVGNPFNLASTVTAGIVSAKGRNINILENLDGKNNTAIESFIQTDAAINPGNSGGALVNTRGDLIGINTAIATPTGTYAGYGFAVPSNIVAKVVNDLKEFGTVQRAFIGATIQNIDETLMEKHGLTENEGVFLENVIEDGAADEAGLKSGDVIIAINQQKIMDVAALQEKIASFSPGNSIDIQYVRNGKVNNVSLILKNKFNNKELLNNTDLIINKMGLSVAELSKNEKIAQNIKNGIKVVAIKKGYWIDTYTDMQENFIITHLDDIEISSVEDFTQALANKKGKIMIEGKYPNNNNVYLYALKID
jgi:serine protease Do